MYTKYLSKYNLQNINRTFNYTFTMNIMFQRPVINYYVLRFTQPSGTSIQIQPHIQLMRAPNGENILPFDTSSEWLFFSSHPTLQEESLFQK
jgi:hypothetical protein